MIKNAIIRDKLARQDGLLCFEMEAAGALAGFPCLVVRGIADYCDSHKNDRWHGFAAAAAAAYARQLFFHMLIDEVKRCVSVVSEKNIEHLKHRQDDRDRHEILNWLTSLDYGSQHSDFLKRRQPGTGQWFLDSPELKRWVDGGGKTLFCPGIPGSGKTILASIVIDSLHKKHQNDPKAGIAYVYCNYRRKHEQDAEQLLVSLLKQLCQQWSILPPCIQELYEAHQPKRTRPSIEEITNALRIVADQHSQVFIIIDALDECQVDFGCRARVLTSISDLQMACNVNFLATSRFVAEIQDMFVGKPTLEIRAQEHDVRAYIDGYMSDLPSFVSRSPDLQEQIRHDIVNAVDGMFLLAQLYVDSLRDKTTPRAMKKALSQLRRRAHGESEDSKVELLAKAYHETTERIRRQEVGFRILADSVLLWISCSKRPLTISELRHALAVEAGDNQLDPENLPQTEDMVTVCAGLVTVDEESSIIRLVHYTTQEYFEKMHETWFPGAEDNITVTCITYLSFHVFDSGSCESVVALRDRLQSNPLYGYAARHWGHHAQKASSQAHNMITRFLQSHHHIAASYQAMWTSIPGSLSKSDASLCSMLNSVMGKSLHVGARFGLAKAMVSLEFQNDIEAKDLLFRTPLIVAAENGHERVVQMLLERGANIEASDSLGRTSLIVAAKTGHGAVVKRLLDSGANKNARSIFWETPLIAAAMAGHEAVVQALLEKGADAAARDIHGQTSLFAAAGSGHEGVVRLLLQQGADLNSRGQFDETLLHRAVLAGYKAVVQLLLDNGADLEIKGRRGRTPLLDALAYGHEAVAEMLLQNDADPNSPDADMRVPLHLAAEHGHEEVIKMVLEMDVDMEVKDRKGDTPLLIAAEEGKLGVVRALLEAGANIDAKDEWDETALAKAAKNGHEAVVSLLLEKGADLKSRNRWGATVLFYAAWLGHETVVNILLDSGADADANNDLGATPLMMAARGDCEGVVSLLLEQGADPMAQDFSGETPLSFAKRRGLFSIVAMLEYYQ